MKDEYKAELLNYGLYMIFHIKEIQNNDTVVFGTKNEVGYSTCTITIATI